MELLQDLLFKILGYGLLIVLCLSFSGFIIRIIEEVKEILPSKQQDKLDKGFKEYDGI
ncbi:hypothetical protein [Bergeyella cardium]|uniref:Uncharacterized protein n=1 Tax=Bergeyella cardium TaxID=1585976 RepID=A0A6P1QUJ9_9FLAO|nr:hypothetical protein [Bergeyella cardium]QHN64847.1 hypothetical protein DBX24_02540 [Bergeyella cardium]WHE34155.1 hypothetical protein P8603_02555 [Bergeyella cardium]WHF60806.1 hypothetical protein O0R51_02550 [Bergeyella cardium]